MSRRTRSKETEPCHLFTGSTTSHDPQSEAEQARAADLRGSSKCQASVRRATPLCVSCFIPLLCLPSFLRCLVVPFVGVISLFLFRSLTRPPFSFLVPFTDLSSKPNPPTVPLRLISSHVSVSNATKVNIFLQNLANTEISVQRSCAKPGRENSSWHGYGPEKRRPGLGRKMD